jgi:hypothetical protein
MAGQCRRGAARAEHLGDSHDSHWPEADLPSAAVIARREIVSARTRASLGAAASREALQRRLRGGLHRQ